MKDVRGYVSNLSNLGTRPFVIHLVKTKKKTLRNTKCDIPQRSFQSVLTNNRDENFITIMSCCAPSSGIDSPVKNDHFPTALSMDSYLTWLAWVFFVVLIRSLFN